MVERVNQLARELQYIISNGDRVLAITPIIDWDEEQEADMLVGLKITTTTREYVVEPEQDYLTMTSRTHGLLSKVAP